jgi:hypothetical protein
LSNRAGEDLGGRGLANCFVASDNSIVVCRVRRILVNIAKELFLVLADLATIERSGVHVGDSIVNVAEVVGVGLLELARLHCKIRERKLTTLSAPFSYQIDPAVSTLVFHFTVALCFH